jgi:2-polyprenyl-3-methyl-5-hydroxy-6-metoxy-1,4-benzoquinol methylase
MDTRSIRGRMDLSTPHMGDDVHPAYANPRPEVQALVPHGARRILDVGCSSGVLGAALRARGSHVVGVEHDPKLGAMARSVLDDVVVGDVEAMAADGADPGGPFDCVVCADVLEHLRDPWAVTRWAAGMLDPGGSLVISVPNIRHLQTFWSLAVRRRWPYQGVGIFDRTHLRWFARANLPDLLDGTGLSIVELDRSYMLKVEQPASSRLNSVARHLGDLGTLQFIFRAERRP